MSKANPKKAMAALLPLAIDCGGGVLVAPMTLGMYAALERIGSPLITGEEPKDTLELIPSLYLLTHDPREVFLGNVVDLAMQWAAGQPVTAIGRIREAAERQIGAMLDVLPEAEKKKACRKATGGSRTGSGTAPSGTGGAGARSCGKRQHPPSPSRSGANSEDGRSR